MEHKKKDFSLSWFFRWFLDNKAITVFLVTLLLGLNIFVLSKISFIFIPVLEFMGLGCSNSKFATSDSQLC